MPDRTTRNSSSSASSTMNPTRNGRLLSRLGLPAGLCAFSLSDISTFGTADNLYARNNVPIPTSSVGRAFRTHLQELADNADPAHYKALLEYVDIDVHPTLIGPLLHPGVNVMVRIQCNSSLVNPHEDLLAPHGDCEGPSAGRRRD